MHGSTHDTTRFYARYDAILRNTRRHTTHDTTKSYARHYVWHYAILRETRRDTTNDITQDTTWYYAQLDAMLRTTRRDTTHYTTRYYARHDVTLRTTRNDGILCTTRRKTMRGTTRFYARHDVIRRTTWRDTTLNTTQGIIHTMRNTTWHYARQDAILRETWGTTERDTTCDTTQYYTRHFATLCTTRLFTKYDTTHHYARHDATLRETLRVDYLASQTCSSYWVALSPFLGNVAPSSWWNVACLSVWKSNKLPYRGTWKKDNVIRTFMSEYSFKKKRHGVCILSYGQYVYKGWICPFVRYFIGVIAEKIFISMTMGKQTKTSRKKQNRKINP